MIFRWLTERRREKLLQAPFPDEWSAIIERNVAYWRWLTEDERARLRELIAVFLDEKGFVGCDGLEITDEMRVTIAADACVLLLGLDHDLYRDVETLFVYPSTVVLPERKLGFFEIATAPIDPAQAVVGVAHSLGPVVLVWDEVKRGARNARDGRNVVFHEFAHKIDMLGGDVDGTPPLPDSATRRSWAEVCSEVFHKLQAHEPSVRKVLDPYGATNEAEFFAVATESFFERGPALREALPELYGLLQDFYQQDTAARFEQGPPAA